MEKEAKDETRPSSLTYSTGRRWRGQRAEEGQRSKGEGEGRDDHDGQEVRKAQSMKRSIRSCLRVAYYFATGFLPPHELGHIEGFMEGAQYTRLTFSL
uniref:Uncharacterized protein n=1 Tax=Melanopsichium pennsylvanicum 4 TaxID=1398559 RepID=A0A077R9M5_9BASI|nr:uncharacterized protein BN887_06238 [Melanopsichium pennsylvanicum 4]